MKFQIIYKHTNENDKFRASDWASFENEVTSIFHRVNNGTDAEFNYEFIVDGKIVNLEGAYAAAKSARQEWESKRTETKHPVFVLHGAAHLKSNYHKVWIKK